MENKFRNNIWVVSIQSSFSDDEYARFTLIALRDAYSLIRVLLKMKHA